MKYIFTVISALFLSISCFALSVDDDTTVNLYNETIDDEVVEWLNRLDSLVNTHYYYRYDTLEYGSVHRDSLILDLPDSIYIERIKNISSAVELSFNQPVRRNLDAYIKRGYRQIPRLLTLSEYYFPMFEEILDQYDMPYELKYLAVIESALNPEAVSRVGATGLWQFMYRTGKLQGLEINSYIDERRDPIQSTYAACEFMQSLYNVYDDWLLVLAAYNCGPGNVNRAISRSGMKRSFWEIYHYLPRETRNYVPAYIAVNYVFNYYKEHGFLAEPIDIPRGVDTVVVHHDLHFDQIVACMDIDKEELKFLNPQYKLEVIPANRKPRHLLLPIDKIDDFLAIEDTVHLYKDSIYLNPQKIAYKPNEKFTDKGVPVAQPKGTTKLFYTIKSGDALGLIAGWYDVGVSELKAWNGLYSNRIRAGKKLVVYVPESKASYYEKVNTMSRESKQRREGVSARGETTEVILDPNYEYYTVQKGDNPWSIAQKFSDVSVDDILKLNNLKASSLKVGQKIKIRKKK